MVFWLATVEAREGVRDGGFMGVAFVASEATVYHNRHVCRGRKTRMIYSLAWYEDLKCLNKWPRAAT